MCQRFFLNHQNFDEICSIPLKNIKHCKEHRFNHLKNNCYTKNSWLKKYQLHIQIETKTQPACHYV